MSMMVSALEIRSLRQTGNTNSAGMSAATKKRSHGEHPRRPACHRRTALTCTSRRPPAAAAASSPQPRVECGPPPAQQQGATGVWQGGDRQVAGRGGSRHRLLGEARALDGCPSMPSAGMMDKAIKWRKGERATITLKVSTSRTAAIGCCWNSFSTSVIL
jgi:hypothetical protein